MKKKILSVLVLAPLAAMAGNVEFAGSVQIRSEAAVRNDFDGSPVTPNKSSFTSSRFRLDAKAVSEEGYSVFFQPQFTKFAGKTAAIDSNTTTTGATTGSNTSGNVVDTEMTAHQAYFETALLEKMDLRIGRQELSYGDELVIGALGWNQVGRSFDAAKLKVQGPGEGCWTDIFASKIKDNNVTASTSVDYNFFGLYHSMALGGFAKEFDLYVLDKSQVNSADNTKGTDLYSVGTRAKSRIGNFDYRVEVTGQKGKNSSAQKVSAQQYDVEAGYNLEFWNLRFGLEYFQASKEYDQHFPTVHKFLGWADLFGRRNIKGEVAHVSFKPHEKFKINFDYHIFKRTSTNAPAYKLDGTTSWGALGDKDDAATEFDTKVTYYFKKGLGLELGYMMADPGAYMKDQSANRKDKSTFSYAMVNAVF